MAKLLLRIAILLAVLLLINQVVLGFLPYAWGDEALADKFSYYLQQGNQYDTLFIGSSRIYRQIDPKAFDLQTKEGLRTRSFNMGMAATTFIQNYQLYNEILKLRPPNLRYVVFELGPVILDPGEVNLHTRGLIFWYTPRDTLFLLRAILAEDLPLAAKFRLSSYHLVSLGEKLLNAGMGREILDFALSKRTFDAKELVQRSGFAALDWEKDTAIQKRRAQFVKNPSMLERRTQASVRGMKSGENQVAYNNAYLERYMELLEVSQQNGIHLVFLLPPRLGNSYKSTLPLYQRLPAENRIALADPKDFPAFYSPENSFDVGHLDLNGAQQFSQVLADAMTRLLDSEEANH